MSTSSRSRAAAVGTLGVVALAALRCGPLDTCVRISDCPVGLTCVEGTCHVELSGDEAGAEGGVDASASEAATPVDAGDAAVAASDDAGPPDLKRHYRPPPPPVDPTADDGGGPPPEPDPSGF